MKSSAAWHLSFGIAFLCIFLTACDSTEPTTAPSTPLIIRVADSAQVDHIVEVVAVSESSDASSLTYEVEWGDERGIQSVPDVESGLYVTLRYRYFDAGSYSMRCRTVDNNGRVSAWSERVSIHISGIAVLGRGDWWMYMRNPQHNGQSVFQGPLTPTKKWTYRVASPLRSGASFDAAGNLYIGADDFQLHSLYPDGTPRWRYWSGNARIQNTPAITSDGSACFGGSSANIYSIDRYGIKRWNTSANSPIMSSSAVIDSEGRLYIGSEDKALYCLSPSGSVEWRMLTNGAVTGSPALSHDESRIYIGSTDWVLYALDRQGSIAWTFPTGGPINGSPSIGPNGTVFIGSDDQYLYALRSDGGVLWKRDLHSPIVSTAAINQIGQIYVTTMAGELFCLNNDGSPRWDVRYAPAGGPSSPVLDVLSNVYVASPDGTLTAVSSTGSIRWRYDTEWPLFSTPSISPEGMIIIGNDEGVLYAIGDK